MKNEQWIKEFPVSITVCNTEGVILEMNESASRVFQKDGGSALVGQSVLNCHPEPARSRLKQMLEKPETNSYTIEKNGQKKLIYQCPWFENGVFQGMVELSLPIPDTMPHFVR
ncbi:MAG: diguanylate cyclase [Candidatus Omnitrophota bacterium]